MEFRKSPLLQAIEEGNLSLGTYFTINSPELVEIIGHCGFNHVIIDQMFSALDWGATSNLVRAAHLYGVNPVIRVQTYPWGSMGGDTRVPAEIARALGIGAGAAMASIGSVAELEACLRIQRDAAHGRIWMSPDVQDWERRREAGEPAERSEFFVVPLIELTSLIDDIESVVSLQGLRAVAIGIHDICVAVGHPFDVEHPDVWKDVDRVVAAAEVHGVSVWVNVGYRYRRADEMIARIGRLREHGVNVIQVQGPETLVQHMLTDIAAGTLHS